MSRVESGEDRVLLTLLVSLQALQDSSGLGFFFFFFFVGGGGGLCRVCWGLQGLWCLLFCIETPDLKLSNPKPS